MNFRWFVSVIYRDEHSYRCSAGETVAKWYVLASSSNVNFSLFNSWQQKEKKKNKKEKEDKENLSEKKLCECRRAFLLKKKSFTSQRNLSYSMARVTYNTDNTW